MPLIKLVTWWNVFKRKRFERSNQISKLKIDFENQNLEMFEEVVDDFDESDDEII